MMSAPIDTGTSFKAGTAVRVIDASVYSTVPAGRNFDISHDGRRFLMIKNEAAPSATQIHVVLNWFEELKRLVPAN